MAKNGLPALTRKRFFEPVQELRGRIGLVVMLAVWEDRQLVEVFGEPRRGLGDVDKAALEDRGLRMQTHGLVAGRLVPRGAMAAVGDQLLDQLSARGLVLDQYNARTEQALLLAHGALERRILEPPAEHTEQEELLATHSPGCADREIAELGGFVGGVPALHDAVETLWQFVLAVAFEPFGLDQSAA